MKIMFFRRLTQVSLLGLFVLGNIYGFKVLVGDLSASIALGIVPLSDPFATLQLLLAGATLTFSGIMGAILVFAFYATIASRAFCSWVCPINLFSDVAYKIRYKFGFNKDRRILNLNKNTRYYILVLSLILSAFLGIAAFESISQIGIVTRGVVFLQGSVVGFVLCIIAFDVFLLERGICSHLCPLGAFYAVISKFSLIRIKHTLQNCTKCNKCKLICPEVQVLDMIGKRSDFVRNTECISCGRCIDVCDDNALEFSIRDLRR